MFRLILQGMAVFILSLALGGLGVYLFSLYRGEEKPVRTLTLNLQSQDTGLVEEVLDANGLLMDQLAYSFTSAGNREQAVSLLLKAGISAEIHGSRVMVPGGKSGLALDILSLEGYIPGVENFTFTDITAPQGTLQYKIQNRLATQNLLSNMVATMTEGVEAARVSLGSESIVGDLDNIQVVIQRKPGVNGLSVADLEGVRSNIVAMTGISDAAIIKIVDRETGDKY